MQGKEAQAAVMWVYPINKLAFGFPGALTFPREELRHRAVREVCSQNPLIRVRQNGSVFLDINTLQGKQVLQVLNKITLKVSSPCNWGLSANALP